MKAFNWIFLVLHYITHKSSSKIYRIFNLEDRLTWFCPRRGIMLLFTDISNRSGYFIPEPTQSVASTLSSTMSFPSKHTVEDETYWPALIWTQPLMLELTSEKSEVLRVEPTSLSSHSRDLEQQPKFLATTPCNLLLNTCLDRAVDPGAMELQHRFTQAPLSFQQYNFYMEAGHLPGCDPYIAFLCVLFLNSQLRLVQWTNENNLNFGEKNMHYL